MATTRRALLSYASFLSFPGILLETATALAQAGPVRVRQNIVQFAQDSQKVAALRAGVRKMKDRSKTNEDDPLGWYYWSAVHGTNKPVPAGLQGVYRQCEHTPFRESPFQPVFVAEHFISWHRPFLFFFEAALKRAAEEAGSAAAFELPYWNWYTTGTLPTIFTEGTENTNPLLHPRVNNGVNSATLDRAFFAQKDLLPPSIPLWRRSFAVPFELDPHGLVHDVLGGEMGSISTSARDPIFWLHHANIDRLWTVWTKMADGRKNPGPASTWAQQVFKYDKTGQMTQTAGAVVDSVKSLNYRYDDESPFPAPPPPGPMIAMLQLEAAPQTAATVAPGAGAATVSKATSLSLGNQSVAIDMKLPAATQGQLQTLALPAASAAPGAITGAWLVLENVEIAADGQDGGFSFSIKVTLPDGASGSREVKLGQLGKFTWPAASSQDLHDHARPPITLTIPLKDVLQELGVSKPADLAKGLRVVFEAAHPEKPGSTNPQFVKIGSISIKTTDAPLQ